MTVTTTPSLIDRIMRRTREAPSGCVEWLGPPDRLGYGRVWDSAGKPQYVHRVVYTARVGPIPEGLVIDHLCRNPSCCEPTHLEPVTRAENNRRGQGLPAQNGRKTVCASGHAFDPANTYRSPTGRRSCRTCNASAARAYKARREAALAAIAKAGAA